MKTKTTQTTLLLAFHFQMFATDITANMTKITAEGMTAENKVMYFRNLLQNADEQDVFSPYGMVEHSTHGLNVEWRRPNTFAPAMEPLEEGVIPPGEVFGISTVTGKMTQHGSYTPISDVLEMAGFDNNIWLATTEMGRAMGKTRALLTRNGMMTGTNVFYAPKSDGTEVTVEDDLDETCVLTPDLINSIRTAFVEQNVPKINGYWLFIAHPHALEDLRNSDEWKEYHKYNDVQKIFKGEMGELHGFKFIESPMIKIAKASEDAPAVYKNLAFGADAYGIPELEGAGAELIIHEKNEIGGPIDQFSTVGYKLMHNTTVLYQERLMRVETCSAKHSMKATVNL